MSRNVIEKPKFRLSISAICLSIVTVLFTGGTLAQYYSSFEGISGARVAIWAADAKGADLVNATLNCNTGNNSLSYPFSVMNQENGKTSEVAMSYSIRVVLSNTLPTGVSIEVDGLSGVVSSDGKLYEFTNSQWVFGSGTSDSRSHELVLSADPSVVTFNVSIPEVSIGVVAVQVD